MFWALRLLDSEAAATRPHRAVVRARTMQGRKVGWALPTFDAWEKNEVGSAHPTYSRATVERRAVCGSRRGAPFGEKAGSEVCCGRFSRMRYDTFMGHSTDQRATPVALEYARPGRRSGADDRVDARPWARVMAAVLAAANALAIVGLPWVVITRRSLLLAFIFAVCVIAGSFTARLALTGRLRSRRRRLAMQLLIDPLIMLLATILTLGAFALLAALAESLQEIMFR